MVCESSWPTFFDKKLPKFWAVVFGPTWPQLSFNLGPIGTQLRLASKLGQFKQDLHQTGFDTNLAWAEVEPGWAKGAKLCQQTLTTVQKYYLDPEHCSKNGISQKIQNHGIFHVFGQFSTLQTTTRRAQRTTTSRQPTAFKKTRQLKRRKTNKTH